MTTGAVCVFAKPPVPGRSKTRLAEGIGEERAAALAAAFLQDTIAALGPLDCAVVLATTDTTADFGPLPTRVRVLDQGTGDLGARIERVLAEQLRDRPWAIALGADSPGLPPALLERAILELERGNAVLGPTDDGGFYLLGLVHCPRGLLAQIPWSSAITAQRTVRALEDHQLGPVRLDPWFDVDRPEDLVRFRGQVPRSRAPATWAALDEGPSA